MFETIAADIELMATNMIGGQFMNSSILIQKLTYLFASHTAKMPSCGTADTSGNQHTG